MKQAVRDSGMEPAVRRAASRLFAAACITPCVEPAAPGPKASDALVKRYAIDAGRLAAAGSGKSRPKGTNDTLEGRARNRRVELVRQ